MKKVEDYERIRKAYHIEGLSIREISRRYKHGRKLIRKALEHAAPEPFQINPARNAGILGAYQDRILALLKESEQLPRKQRYTAHTIYKILDRRRLSRLRRVRSTTLSAAPRKSSRQAKPICRWNLIRAKMPRSIGAKRWSFWRGCRSQSSFLSCA